jgi:hypothetical protein
VRPIDPVGSSARLYCAALRGPGRLRRAEAREAHRRRSTAPMLGARDGARQPSSRSRWAPARSCPRGAGRRVGVGNGQGRRDARRPMRSCGGDRGSTRSGPHRAVARRGRAASQNRTLAERSNDRVAGPDTGRAFRRAKDGVFGRRRNRAAEPVPTTLGHSVLAAKWPKPRKPKGFRRRGGSGVTASKP